MATKKKAPETAVEETVTAVNETAVEETVKPEEPKVYIVETPVKNFCGIGAAGVHFAYGKAEVCEGWVLNWFKEHGYKVTEKK